MTTFTHTHTGRGAMLRPLVRSLILIVSLCAMPFTARAQQADPQTVIRQAAEPAVTADSLARQQTLAVRPAPVAYGDSLRPLGGCGQPGFLPVATFGDLGLGGYGLDGLSPYGSTYGAWRLHEGFNAQLGLSASVAFGKHAPRGVGFGQTAAFAYLAPLTPRLSIGAGLYATNMDWGAWRRTDVGIGGMLAYQLTDRVNLYAYGSKTFMPRDTWTNQMRRDPFPLFLDQARERIGAAAEFKIGNNAMIGISVEHRSY